jgi:hypothetical protein
MPMLDPGRRRTRNCQFWAHAMDDGPPGGPSPPAVAFAFADSRGTDEIAGQLAGFSGILQVDELQTGWVGAPTATLLAGLGGTRGEIPGDRGRKPRSGCKGHSRGPHACLLAPARSQRTLFSTKARA